MALASETRSTSDYQRGLLRRSSSTPSSPVIEAVDFCRSKPRLVELEKQLYSLANDSRISHEAIRTCQSLLCNCDNINGIFNVFCSCSWVDRYRDPIISQLFYELVSAQHDNNSGMLLLAELETACEELLKVLTHLGTPNTLQLNVISLLYSLSRLSALPSSHEEAVQSYLEEIARALWPYSKPSAPNLWANDAFCDAQCDILKACGKFLEEKCPVNTERTFQMITGKVISGDISKYSRFRLLEIQELRSSHWKCPEATANYYKEAYLKTINQTRKDMLLNDIKTSPKNGLTRINSIGETKNQDSIKSVTVVRISENELRKSCENMQQELVIQNVIAEEKNDVANDKSSPLVDCTELFAKLNISDSATNASTANKCLNGTSSKGNPFLHRTDLVKGMKPSDNGLKLCSFPEDGDKLGAAFETGKDTMKQPLSRSYDFTGQSVGRAASPCSSSGSDDVFASSSSELNTGNKVIPALHRGDFKKPRRPFKSDSSLNSCTESLATKTTLPDSKGSTCHKKMLTRTQSDLPSSAENKSISHGLESETHPVKAAVPSDLSQDSNIASYKSKLVDEQAHNIEQVRENWRVDSYQENQNGDASTCSLATRNMQSWRQKKLSISTEESDSWRERKLSDTYSSPENNNGQNSVSQNWRERKLSGTDNTLENKNGHSSATQEWRERKLSGTDSALENNGHSSAAQDWRERKLSGTDSALENKNSQSSDAQNWRERKLSGTDKNLENSDGHHSLSVNWRERRPSLDSKELESANLSNTGASSENWRERKPDQPSDFWSSGSHHENWRDRKSMSVEESRKDAFSSSGQRSKRHSTGDIQLERQDSNEKGKCSPAGGGGFGLPKQTGRDNDTSASIDEAPKEELHEIQITEEESQGLKGWKLNDIKIETGCRIFHKRDKCVIEIRGDPQQCKVAKKRVYSVVAASQEEFGALVPLSDEVLEHLQIEGCGVLAERLSLSSGATVKMINDKGLCPKTSTETKGNSEMVFCSDKATQYHKLFSVHQRGDTQLFISGHRTCVNLAKTQLAKIKVMLRYTDDPDVQSPSQQDKSEGKHKQVEELFATLEGRPRSLTDSNIKQVSAEGNLTRDFLLSCSLSPAARQRPVDLSLDRPEDWVKDIVLANMRRGEQAVLEQIAPKKGFGSPNSDSRHPAT